MELGPVPDQAHSVFVKQTVVVTTSGWRSIGLGLEHLWWAEYGDVRGIEDGKREGP